MLSSHRLYFIQYMICCCTLLSCNKQAFLDKKPSTDIFIPTTLEDFQALLDNDSYMGESPIIGELSADNYYLLHPYWQTLPAKERNSYIWAADIYEGVGKVEDWNTPYKQVFYANVVLEGLNKLPMTSNNEKEWKAIKGAALFIRGYAFYNIAQLFAPVYNSVTAGSDKGIPLRLTPDLEGISVRSTVLQTYNQLLSDLKEASQLLPGPIAFNNRNRPSRPAAMAMLARVYLSMSAYQQAGVYADSCLQLYNTLINYNILNPSTSIPFVPLNAETIYQNRLLSGIPVLSGLFVPSCIVDSLLYRSYAVNDLRRDLFYFLNADKLPNTKGSYNGTVFPFSGLATDEVYLIRAECFARAENVVAAMNDLNVLLLNRWKTGTFIPFTATTASEALQKILEERRKELAFRGLRWTDLRRLNKEGANITLRRNLNGQPFQLLPGERRYVLPIPPDVINLTGMEQNPRN